MVERLSSQAALERIQRLRDDDLLILGVDGFRVRSDGFEAPTDLILDLSAGQLSVIEAD